ncbi:MAG TPA: alpha/beta fold hydrolase [Thermoanaerobaculia bacterium]|nr:alpha/beta fold hydrolase [Thermoanaerobaculia bacterium]
MDLRAHYWTVAPRLRGSWAPLAPPPSRPWETWVEDPAIGPVRLTGRLAAGADGGAGGGELLVVVHGLSGCCDSVAVVRAARAARAAGLATLRLNLRGSDRRERDFYHAGLTADLHAALASPELAGFTRIYLLGWSLGGHLALRAATEPADPRLAAVAALCAPLDLAAAVDAIDRPGLWAYRRAVLGGLKEIYAACAARRPGPLPVAAARRVARLREWDDRVVAPRHGFAGAADYYTRMSVGPRLPALRVPALYLGALRDPMVPAAAVRPSLEPHADAPLEVRWLARGGHCAFPEPVEPGVIEWLRAARRSPRQGPRAPYAAGGTARSRRAAGRR